MSNYISINIQKAKSLSQSINHSLRTQNISYLLENQPKPNTIFFDENIEKNIDNLKNYQAELTQKIKNDYTENQYRINKKTNEKYKVNRKLDKNAELFHEAVISFSREQFEKCSVKEIEKHTDDFIQKFERKYGCKVLMKSLHLDEGHIEIIEDDKDKEKKIIKKNYHTHLLIQNYNFETHKTCFSKGALDYRKLQDELAESFKDLNFERGDKDKKAVRLEHKEYKELAKTQAELKAHEKVIEKFEEINNTYIHAQSIADFALKIEQLTDKKGLLKEVQGFVKDLRTSMTNKVEQKDYQKLKAQKDELEKQIKADNFTLEQLNNQLKKIRDDVQQAIKDKAQAIKEKDQALAEKFKHQKESIRYSETIKTQLKTIEENKTTIEKQINAEETKKNEQAKTLADFKELAIKLNDNKRSIMRSDFSIINSEIARLQAIEKARVIHTPTPPHEIAHNDLKIAEQTAILTKLKNEIAEQTANINTDKDMLYKIQTATLNTHEKNLIHAEERKDKAQAEITKKQLNELNIVFEDLQIKKESLITRATNFIKSFTEQITRTITRTINKDKGFER